jgi:hypothetical protein
MLAIVDLGQFEIVAGVALGTLRALQTGFSLNAFKNGLGPGVRDRHDAVERRSECANLRPKAAGP